MSKPKRLAIVITHLGARGGVVDAPWLEMGFRIDASDWIVLSEEGWRAVAEGDPVIWEALERKLLVGFYVSQPALIAVIGHPGGRRGDQPEQTGQAEVGRIARRIRSLLLPSAVLGFWSDENGWLQDFVELDEPAEGEPAGDPELLEEAELAGGTRA
jgi:hypothetical protein